jgi:hypothetical protein
VCDQNQHNKSHPRNMPFMFRMSLPTLLRMALATFIIDRSELKLRQLANMPSKLVAFATFNLERSKLKLAQPQSTLLKSVTFATFHLESNYGYDDRLPNATAAAGRLFLLCPPDPLSGRHWNGNEWSRPWRLVSSSSRDGLHAFFQVRSSRVLQVSLAVAILRCS